MALRNLGATFERYRAYDFDKDAVKSYNAIHCTNFEPTDIRDVKGEDLGIVDKAKPFNAKSKKALMMRISVPSLCSLCFLRFFIF
mgnify:CR=1 FL=1